MITASHNPAPDNGYKLYLGGADAGSQLVSPADREVLAAIEAVVADGGGADGGAPDAVRPRRGRPARPVRRRDRRMRTVRDRRRRCRGSTRRCTASGSRRCSRVLAAAGLPAPAVVPEQAEPGPGLPDRAVPEPGGAGHARPRDRARGPHRRRARARERPGRGPAGGRRARTGGRLAAADRQRGGAAARLADRAGGRPVGGSLACSIVSTPGLARIAERFGFRARRDAHRASSGSPARPDWRSGSRRRSATSSTPTSCGTRTGSRRSSWRCRPRSSCSEEGRTLLDLLDEIEEAIGRFDSDQVSIRVDDLGALGAMTGPAPRGTRRRRSAASRCCPADDLARRVRGAPADGRAALPARGRRARDRAPLRHRAEAEGLPRRGVGGADRGRARGGDGDAPSTRSGARSGPCSACDCMFRCSGRLRRARTPSEMRLLEGVGELRLHLGLVEDVVDHDDLRVGAADRRRRSRRSRGSPARPRRARARARRPSRSPSRRCRGAAARATRSPGGSRSSRCPHRTR